MVVDDSWCDGGEAECQCNAVVTEVSGGVVGVTA